MKIDTIIKNNFGSKQGLLNYLKYQLYRYAGVYSYYRNINLQKVNRFVFVCDGNICRSPLAEAVMRHNDIPATSYGLTTRGGDKADPRAIKFGMEHGFDLSGHITQPIAGYHPLEQDLLIAMEPRQLKKTLQLFPDSKATALGLWLPIPNVYLHDPFSTTTFFFEKCETDVVHATENILKVHHSQQQQIKGFL